MSIAPLVERRHKAHFVISIFEDLQVKDVLKDAHQILLQFECEVQTTYHASTGTRFRLVIIVAAS